MAAGEGDGVAVGDGEGEAAPVVGGAEPARLRRTRTAPKARTIRAARATMTRPRVPKFSPPLSLSRLAEAKHRAGALSMTPVGKPDDPCPSAAPWHSPWGCSRAFGHRKPASPSCCAGQTRTVDLNAKFLTEITFDLAGGVLDLIAGNRDCLTEPMERYPPCPTSPKRHPATWPHRSRL